MSHATFGQTSEGQEILIYTLEIPRKIRAKVIPYGGTVVSLEVADQKGEWLDVVLGFDRLEDYLGEHPSIGTLIGRYGNRIAFGKFELE